MSLGRYDPYTDSFVHDDIDLNSYMLGYLAGCRDTVKKFEELNKISYEQRRSSKDTTEMA